MAGPAHRGHREGDDRRGSSVDQGRRRDHGVAARGTEDARRALDGPDARRHPRGGADQGPALLGRRVDEGPALRGRRPDLPRADRPHAQGARRRTDRRGQQGAVGVRAAAGHGRAEPGQHARHQPRGVAARDGDRWGEPAGGHAPVHRGPGQGPDRDDGRVGVRGGPQRRHDAGHRRLPERGDPAHPVHADDREGLPAPAGDHPAVHQQVLHPGSAAGELLRRARGRRGPHGVPGVVAQRRPGAGHADLGRLRRAGRDQGVRGGAGDHRRGQGEHARVLHRRRAAGQWARGAGRAGRAAGRQRDPDDDHARLQRDR